MSSGEASGSGGAWSIERVTAAPSADDERVISELAGVLMDCVEGGASVGFLAGLDAARAERYWRGVVEGARSGKRVLLVARDARGICGTVQLVIDQPENQPHRADVSKMLVHRRARRRGLAAALMARIEREAAACGRDVLVLDTATGSDASRLYERMGWIRSGDIPGYALATIGHETGERQGTTYYYKHL